MCVNVCKLHSESSVNSPFVRHLVHKLVNFGATYSALIVVFTVSLLYKFTAFTFFNIIFKRVDFSAMQ